VWMAESNWFTKLHAELARNVYTNTPPSQIKLNESDLLHHVDEQVAEYFQINSVWNSAYYSQSLRGRRFPFDKKEVFNTDKALEGGRADTELAERGKTAPSLKVHRVWLKAPTGSRGFNPNRGRGNPPPPPGTAGPPAPDRRSSDPSTRPGIYIQCAFD